MEPLADIVAKLLAETAMKAAAPRVGDKLRSMTAQITGGASGMFEGFQQLLSELAGIPEDLQHRMRNQWRRLDSSLAHSPMGGAWDDVKSVFGTLTEQIKAATSWTGTASGVSAGNAMVAPSLTEATRSLSGATTQHPLTPGDITVKVDVPVPDVTQPTMLKSLPAENGMSPSSVQSKGPSWLEMSPLQRLADVFRELERRGLVTEAEKVSQPPAPALAAAVASLSPNTQREGNHPIQQGGVQQGGVQSTGAQHDQQKHQAEYTPSPVDSKPKPLTQERPWYEVWMEKNGPLLAADESQTSMADIARASMTGGDVPADQGQPDGDLPRESSGRWGHSGFLSGLLSQTSGLFSVGKSVASGIGSRMMAAAPTIAATAGGFVSPGVGAAGAGLAATGPAGATVAVVATVIAALAVMPKIIKEFGERIAESNRELANFSPEIASAYAAFDQAAFMRKLNLADATSGSASVATDEWTRTLDSLQGEIHALGTMFNLWSTGVAIIARHIPSLLTVVTGGMPAVAAIVDGKDLLGKIQKDIEDAVRGGNRGRDWGDQLTREMIRTELPGRRKPPAPLPPIGGGK